MHEVYSKKVAVLDSKKLQPGYPHQFKIGDRIRLNSLGKERHPRTVPTGQVVNTSSRTSGYGTVRVLLDGQRVPTRLHWSYLELVTSDC